ncbi:hypothetical protein AC578_5586 [Pseudocercospora eumusae]|uniref:Saccharopine dehydrogenase n=1 Tax=Pseudocercospora eumusae TaxID=321146 RepID=A0A139HT92_9PEZI|nr:hypothetical protein AC578_5586 [Pseudocercospora eumusae]
MASTKILVLGSGMVARPCVEYLTRNGKNEITVACRALETAQKLTHGLNHTKAASLDVQSDDALDKAIAASDLVISLIPYVYHPKVILSACKSKKNVVTTSYVSPAIKALEGAIKDAGIVVLNEVGVDPGVDHVYAVKTISEVHAQGGKINEFYSYCGGVPEPAIADNPLRMKFSWSPRGVFMSQCNSASFFQDDKQVDIPAEDLMAVAKPYHVVDGYDFLAYPNRDTKPFRELYKIPEAKTVIRGSLRYDGNPQLTRALLKTGFLDAQPKSWLEDGITWAELTAKTINARDSSEAALIARIKEIISYADEKEQDYVISGFRWIDLLSATKPAVKGSLLDTIADHLQNKISFKPGERDLVMLQHKFVIEWPNGGKETRTSTLELFGDPKGYSGMSLSVGVTCGVATQLLLDGHPAFNTPGILAPYSPEICEPIREKIEQEGIKMIEKTL